MEGDIKEEILTEELELICVGLPPCKCCGNPAMIKEIGYIPGYPEVIWREVTQWEQPGSEFGPVVGKRVRCPRCKALYRLKKDGKGRG